MSEAKFWNLSKTGTKANMTIYGEISEILFWGDEVTPKAFSDELNALGEVSEIELHLNSPGGDVFAGMAIHSILKRHSAPVTVYVDGLAASIATVVALAGNKIIMPKGSMMMIHNPMGTIRMGTAEKMRQRADLLDKIRDEIVQVYSERTGLDAEKLKAMLDKETWFSAEEAVSNGFADEVEDTLQVAASLQQDKLAIINGIAVDWSLFANAPLLPKMQVYDPEPGDDIEQQNRVKAKLANMKRNLELSELEV